MLSRFSPCAALSCSLALAMWATPAEAQTPAETPSADPPVEAPPPVEATPPAEATPPGEAQPPVEARPPVEAPPPADAHQLPQAAGSPSPALSHGAPGPVAENVASAPASTEPTSAAAEPGAARPAEGGAAHRELEAPNEPGTPSTKVVLHGEYRFRLSYMGDIPLHTEPRSGFPDVLGQNLWASQWLRLTSEVQLEERFRIVGQIDIADGVIGGDQAQGVSASRQPRDGATAFEPRGVDPRWLYLEWLSPIGVVRAGLQPSHWGLGLIANDGTKEPPFGDYRFGNRSIRLLYATRPAGREHPFLVALAGDLVYEDPVARLVDGDRALQAVLAVGYDQGERALGAYVVFRSQTSPGDPSGLLDIQDRLRVWIFDVFGRWDVPEPTGDGRLVAAFEALHVRGHTTLSRAYDRPEEDVRQTQWVVQVGRKGERVDMMLEAGWTSGDANLEDGVQRRATMHPDHRVGLILFPEVLAWSSARAATLAASEDLVARRSPGSQLLPTDGGVAGASYIFNHVAIRPTDWLDLRLGWIWARATTDVVDPFRQRARSRAVAFRGGDSRSRDLGIEVDASAIVRFVRKYGVEIEAGVDGGVLVPGHAFDDDEGRPMRPVGLVRVRAGLRF